MDVNFDDGAIFDLLNGSDGPVWQLVNELSEEAAIVARTLVRVRTTPTWSERSDAAAVGATLASITAHMGYNNEGHIFGGINAIEIPDNFPGISARRPAAVSVLDYGCLEPGSGTSGMSPTPRLLAVPAHPRLDLPRLDAPYLSSPCPVVPSDYTPRDSKSWQTFPSEALVAPGGVVQE